EGVGGVEVEGPAVAAVLLEERGILLSGGGHADLTGAAEGVVARLHADVDAVLGPDVLRVVRRASPDVRVRGLASVVELPVVPAGLRAARAADGASGVLHLQLDRGVVVERAGPAGVVSPAAPIAVRPGRLGADHGMEVERVVVVEGTHVELAGVARVVLDVDANALGARLPRLDT